jgi:hypothetical protein
VYEVEMAPALSNPIDTLRRRAQLGDVDAMTELGKWLLIGPREEMGEGIRLLDAAAHGSGGEAAALVSVLSAAGAGTPQSWDNGLDYLRRSAQLGWAPARRELLMMAGDRALAEQAGDGSGLSVEDWKRLRASVDLNAWLRSPSARVLSPSPGIGAIEGFVPPAMCDALIDISRDKLTRALVYDPETGGSLVDANRSNSTIDFTILDASFLLILMRAKIALTSGFDVLSLEPPSVLHYAVGQQFTPHYDYLDPGQAGYVADMDWKGQRVATFLVYLNDDFEGGETDFPVVGVRFKGRKGEALFFSNVGPAGAPDRRTLHAGLPPTKGEKWLFSQWIRDRTQAPRPSG